MNTNISQCENHDDKKSKWNVENSEYKSGDYLNIALLIWLYFLQGISAGFSIAIPLYLQSRKVSYDDQAIFSLSYWVFCLKILWAPLVDSIYSSKFGRRKSWLVPVQYFLGATFFFISMNLNDWLGDENTKQKPNIAMLTTAFLVCTMLTSIQDVTVDGLALALLQRENIGYLAICNTVGFSFGKFVAFTVSMNLDSADFCNKWFRSRPEPKGIISLSEFMRLWAIIYVLSTTLIMIFKKEKNAAVLIKGEKQDTSLNVRESFKALYSIAHLKSVQSLILLIITYKVITIVGTISTLKIVEYGVPKEKIAIVDVSVMPFQFSLPFFFRNFFIGSQPVNMLLRTIIFILILNIFEAVLIYFIPALISDHDLPLWYFILVLISQTLGKLTMSFQTTIMGGFFARISDPRVGATYITLLNTIGVFSRTIPQTIALWMVKCLTWKRCFITGDPDNNKIYVQKETCEITIDGYFVEIAICTVIGIIWIWWCKKKFCKLQCLPNEAWLLPIHTSMKS